MVLIIRKFLTVTTLVTIVSLILGMNGRIIGEILKQSVTTGNVTIIESEVLLDMIWITSDHHFNHENIIKYANRPFRSVTDMNVHMIDKWNSVVRPGDMVLHLGDFALQMDEEAVTELVSKLHGNIILVRGNHDRFGVAKYKRCGFVDVKKKIEFKNFILTHRPIPIEDLDGKINIHGHVHNSLADDYSINHVNVSVEMWDYTPIDFIELISNKTP